MITSRSNQVGITSSALACVGMNEREKKEERERGSWEGEKEQETQEDLGMIKFWGYPVGFQLPCHLTNAMNMCEPRTGEMRALGLEE